MASSLPSTLVVTLIVLQLAACQGSATQSPSSQLSCTSIGGAKVADIDWSPGSDSIATLSSLQDGVVSVGRLRPADGAITELARFLQVAPASITMGPDEAVYWQRSDEGTTQLFRKRPGQDIEVWNVPGIGFSSLEATRGGIVGSVLIGVGQDADKSAVVDVDLGVDGTVVTRTRSTLFGLGSVSVAPDGETIALSQQLAVAEPVTISVSGSADWSVSVNDTSGDRIALTPDASAVMFVQASTGTAMLVDKSGTVTESVLGEREVLAFDIGRSGMVAAGSRNITGGPGSICFAQ